MNINYYKLFGLIKFRGEDGSLIHPAGLLGTPRLVDSTSLFRSKLMLKWRESLYEAKKEYIAPENIDNIVEKNITAKKLFKNMQPTTIYNNSVVNINNLTFLLSLAMLFSKVLEVILWYIQISVYIHNYSIDEHKFHINQLN